MNDNPLHSDLDHILVYTPDIWEELRGCRLFITGGTGFFGCWFLESFAWANEKKKLGASAVVLTRDVGSLKQKAPHLAANPSISFHIGDIRNFSFPSGNFDYIIHAAATSALATFQGETPLEKFDNVVGGTRRVLDFAVQCKPRKILYTSSGAVYGKQPQDMSHIPEDYCGAPAPFNISSAWGESKRAAELLCACYSEIHGLDVKVARCFSFVGPYLQLDIHYAIGNFIRDCLQGRTIKINGDGTPRRSYLYAADLVIWLMTILIRGDSNRVYNVGSEEVVTVSDLAYIIAEGFGSPLEVNFIKSVDYSKSTDSYVPSTILAKNSLGLNVTINLNDAITRTVSWHERFKP